MDLAPQEVWSRLLECARREIADHTFKTWLEPTQAVELRGDKLTVAVPDQFSADWNESKHAALLTSLAPIALGQPCQVEFIVDARSRQRVQMDLFVAPPSSTTSGTTNGVTPAPRPLLNAKYTLKRPAAISTRSSSTARPESGRRTSCRRWRMPYWRGILQCVPRTSAPSSSRTNT
jgi:chromosomal replication initiation ATPase DnaA